MDRVIVFGTIDEGSIPPGRTFLLNYFMLSLLLGLVMAQEATNTPVATPTISLINQYKQDYSFQVAEYQKKYINYVDKNEVYTKYRTVSTEKDKITATKDALFARNLMLKSYLMALRVSLDEFKDQNPTVTSKIQIELSRWEDWCNEQNLIIPNLNSQADITDLITVFKEKYIFIQQIIYTALTQNQINQRLQILDLTKQLSESIKSDPKTGTMLNDWLSALPVKSDLVMASLKTTSDLSQAKQLINRFNNFYPDAKSELNRTNIYLTNMLSDLRAVAIKLNQ